MSIKGVRLSVGCGCGTEGSGPSASLGKTVKGCGETTGVGTGFPRYDEERVGRLSVGCGWWEAVSGPSASLGKTVKGCGETTGVGTGFPRYDEEGVVACRLGVVGGRRSQIPRLRSE